ncbi:HAUS6 protein, partial [Podargus strigoides]|nr:HAUS6 protein [Podargus strigoides]
TYRMKQNDQNKSDKTERIQKVRTMWTLIMEILTSLKKRKEVLDSVLEERVDCCILDGSNVFGVPRILACRVESDIEQLCTGNVYEAGKLNFLVVIQLLNEALRTLRDEHCQFELKNFQLIEDKITHCNNTLQRLEAKRLKRKALHPVSVSGSLYRKQEEWKAKWKSVLGLCPFDLILCQDPVSSVQFI